MQQRRPRLGDILDDYCPRERRVTNHAVVAIVDDDVRQTRCSTCDAEHEYRQGKTPTPRRAKSQAALTHEATDAARPVLAVPRPQAEAAPEAADVPGPGPRCRRSASRRSTTGGRACRHSDCRSTAHPYRQNKTSPSRTTRVRTMARCIAA